MTWLSPYSTPMYTSTLMTTTAQLSLIRDEYNDFLVRVPEHTIFQTYDFLKTWWDTFGGKELDLRVLVIRETIKEKLVAVAPFYIRRNRGFKILRLIGDRHSDYGHIISSIDAESLVLGLGFPFRNWFSWDVIQLNSIPRMSKTRDISTHLNKGGISAYEISIDSAWGLMLTGDWQKYYRSLAKKLRNDTVRQMRRLDKYGNRELVSINRDRINENLDLFFKMHNERWAGIDKTPMFSDEFNREFFRKIALVFDRKGYLDFKKLVINDRVLAMHLGYRYGHRFYYYLPVFNVEYQKYSVGRILILELIKRAYEDGLEYFDFMAGNEPYKKEFANNNIELYRIHVINRNIKGRLYNLIKFYVKPLLSDFDANMLPKSI